MKLQQCKILILTGSIGSGHVTVARAISEAVYRAVANNNDANISVEIVDAITTLKNFASTATKNFYLNSLKISPKIYEMIFEQSADVVWPLQLLNAISAPFMQKKFLNLLQEKQPTLLVSTFPIWDILIKKTWKKYLQISPQLSRPAFVSVITDLMNIHGIWTTGEPDFFIAPNSDTRTSLKHFGVNSNRVKVFGLPISKRCFKPELVQNFRDQLNLSSKRKTLLLILSSAMRWQKVKSLAEAICATEGQFKKLQLIIVAAKNEKWKRKLEKFAWPWPTQVFGWTNEMYKFIHIADAVLTKAGGATVMECINNKKPMIIVDAIPGQEIGNLMFVQKYNLGVTLDNNLANLSPALQYIFKNEKRIKRNLASQQKPFAAETTAKFFMKLIK